MQIVTDYKELTLTETIERLKEMVKTQQPYRYNDETIYNAIKYLRRIEIINKYRVERNK